VRNYSKLICCTRGGLGAVLALLTLTATEPAWAQSSVRDPAGVKQERDEVRRKLDALKKEINETSGEKNRRPKHLACWNSDLKKPKIA